MNKIAIMTAGGDCAGLNSVIKTVTLSAIKQGVEVVGILDGYIGFVENRYIKLDEKLVDNIDNIGGTILGSSNKECPFHYPTKSDKSVFEDKVEYGIKSLKDIGIEGLIIIGGDGTLDSARVISEKGMPVIGIPKTIDNDMVASNPTIGFQTAIENVVDCIRKLKTTAFSHRRVMVVEMMGRTSGYLTLHSGFASGCDIILLPENDYDLDKVISNVNKVMSSSKRYCIIAISEASKQKGSKETISRVIEDSFEQKRFGGVSTELANKIEELTGYEARPMILGHLQRGGSPCSADIILGSRLGEYALNLLLNKEFGYIVGAQDNKLIKMKFLKKRKARLLDYKKDDLIKTARNIGITFGD